MDFAQEMYKCQEINHILTKILVVYTSKFLWKVCKNGAPYFAATQADPPEVPGKPWTPGEWFGSQP